MADKVIEENTEVLSFLDTPEDNSSVGDGKTIEGAAKVEEIAPEKVADPVVVADKEVVPPVTDKEAKTVPLRTFLDVIDENKDLKNKLKSGKETPAGDEVQFEIPDPVKNPVEYAAYKDTMFTFNIMNERMENSERFARSKHGDEVINKVQDWALKKMDEDEAFGNRIVNSRDPYEAALAAYTEATELTEYRAWVAGGKKPEDAPGAKKVTEQPAPRKLAAVPEKASVIQQPAEEAPMSIADATSAGGAMTVPVGDGQAFDGLFGGDKD